MKRKPFLLKLLQTTPEDISDLWPRIKRCVEENGGSDFSLWQAEDLVFGYFETEDERYPNPAGLALADLLEQESGRLFVISLCNMRLMYSAVNRPLADKSKVAAHRVFMAKIKPGCAEEYLKRHHGLELIARGQVDTLAVDPAKEPSGNMTIWNGGDYICGYNEMEEIPAADDPNSGGNEAWERNMLKIMDWLTDDADRFSGLTHAPVKRLL